MAIKNSKDMDDLGREKMFSFLEKHGVVHKDITVGAGTSRKKSTLSSQRRSSGSVIDLHGYTADQAASCLRNSLQRLRTRGIKRVIVIHGQGHHSNFNNGPVLKSLVRDMLDNEFCLFVRDYRTALPKEGGEGATVVWLK